MLEGVKDERLGPGGQAAALLLPMKGQRVVLQQICLMICFRLSIPVQEGLSPDGGERDQSCPMGCSEVGSVCQPGESQEPIEVGAEHPRPESCLGIPGR